MVMAVLLYCVRDKEKTEKVHEALSENFPEHDVLTANTLCDALRRAEPYVSETACVFTEEFLGRPVFENGPDYGWQLAKIFQEMESFRGMCVYLEIKDKKDKSSHLVQGAQYFVEKADYNSENQIIDCASRALRIFESK